jgi:DNA-binding transcriptional ArsR family regulator
MTADVFHAVADANRRRILDLLMGGEKPVGELADHFDMTFQGVSQHLKILAAAGLVTKRRQGRFQVYRAAPERLREIHDWAAQYEKFWRRRLRKLGSYLDES